MKALAGCLWVAAAYEASTVAGEAFVYTSESWLRQTPANPPSISPNTARLLFAQRLGLSQYHSLQDTDESTLETLNVHGGNQQHIFTQKERSRDAEKLLLVVEGVDEEIIGQPIIPAFKIDPQPPSTQNLQLVVDLLNQDRDSKQKGPKPCFVNISGGSSVSGGLMSSRLESRECNAWYNNLNQDGSGALDKSTLSALRSARDTISSESAGLTTILHVSSLQNLTPKDGDRYHAILSDIRTFIHDLLPNSRSISYTIVLMPPTPKSSKRSATSLYGSYNKRLSARQQQSEEPLSSSSTASSPSAPEIAPLQASASPLPHGILPICHTSLQSCIETTNNCSGHGTPYKKPGGAIDCFACKCSKTILTDDEGRVKTVSWGGPACQKKDVSVPFFLLAGISIALIGAVSWGIGLMASVGQEDLPSVIGAGVAGPRAQK
ncbi:hypothetical protein BDR22DRAFT_890691 [Usnea florida]